MPNTFGPRQEVGDEFGDAEVRGGELLTDDRYFDNLSGQQAYKCFACRVKRKAGREKCGNSPRLT